MGRPLLIAPPFIGPPLLGSHPINESPTFNWSSNFGFIIIFKFMSFHFNNFKCFKLIILIFTFY